MTAVDLEAPATAKTIGRHIGVHPDVVSRWAAEWHGPVGSGHRRALCGVDMLVGRAWREITGGRGGWHHTRPAWPTLRNAEHAIRSDPRRWLLIAGDLAATYDDAETAASAWVDSGQPAGRIVDLWSVPDA